jgi:hypothetical protein
MWADNDFQVIIAERAGGGGVTNLSNEADDEMESWANKSNYNACWWHEENGGGTGNNMPAVSNDRDMAPWDADEAQSWRTQNGC